MKFKSMSFEKLIVARAQIEAELDKRIATRRLKLIEAINELRGMGPGKKRGRPAAKPHPLAGNKLPPRYRNPANPEETWAGRGHKPRWLAAALKNGKKLEAFAIK